MAYLLLLLLLLFPSLALAQTRTDIDIPMTKKVMVINFNPIIESQGGQRLTQVLGWGNPEALQVQYINDIKTASGNVVNYSIVDQQEVDDFPTKADGFDYTDDSYLNCWNNHATCHSPDSVNYLEILNRFEVCGKRNRGEIDELWLWGGPWFGYWEANMAGVGAYNTNGPVINGSSCEKPLHIMGFSYERGISEMLEDLGHRTEGTMRYVYGGWRFGYNTPPLPGGTDSMFDKFSVRASHIGYTNLSPACGNIHLGPNSPLANGYDWNNSSMVNSNCEDWLNYPNLTGATEQFNAQRWGNDGYGFKKWWFGHIPKYRGIGPDGKLNNWWRYILDYGEATLAETAPIGWQDDPNISTCTLGGWACDLNKPFQPLNVNFYEGSTIIGSTVANSPNDPGVIQACNGSTNNRFNFQLPENLRNGMSHEITAIAQGIDTGGTENGNNPGLSGNPKTISCGVSPTPSPSYTIQDLKTLIQNYTSANDANYKPVDGKINSLDLGYIIHFIN